MKILAVNFGMSGFAGDSNQLFTITKNLISLGHQVTIVTTDANAVSYTHLTLPKNA